MKNFSYLTCVLVFLLNTTRVYAQPREIELVDFFANWLTQNDSFGYGRASGYQLDNCYIRTGRNFSSSEKAILNSTLTYTSAHPLIKKLKEKYPQITIKIDTAGRLIIPNGLQIRNVNFEHLNLSNLAVLREVNLKNLSPQKSQDKLVIENSDFKILIIDKDNEDPLPLLSLANNHFDTLVLDGPIADKIMLEGNHIKRLKLWSIANELVYISHNIFVPDSIGLRPQPTMIYNNLDQNQYVVQAEELNLQRFLFGGNQIDGKDCSLVSLEVKADEISIYENFINGSLHLNLSKANERFFFSGNHISKYVSLNQFIFSETYNDVSWHDLQGHLASIYTLYSYSSETKDYSYDFNRLENDIQLMDTVAVDQLFRDYYQLYLIFKQNGNLRYANACYSEMKDLEIIRLKHYFQQDRKMKSWFRLQLGNLLKFYTENGTDPAKALVISFYIILVFSVIYLFYPSDWDITSKAKLLASIKSATNKQEPGTFMAIVKSLGLIILSLINALTLSLNSFVTLGFGTIPTYGFARYVCIIEGFLGWFLLTIFSVALINQVLF